MEFHDRCVCVQLIIYVVIIKNIHRYISSPTDRYRAYVVSLRPLGTDKKFRVTWCPDWASNFKRAMQANRSYSHGVILHNKPFDEKLWADLLDRQEKYTHFVIGFVHF